MSPERAAWRVLTRFVTDRWRSGTDGTPQDSPFSRVGGTTAALLAPNDGFSGSVLQSLTVPGLPAAVRQAARTHWRTWNDGHEVFHAWEDGIDGAPADATQKAAFPGGTPADRRAWAHELGALARSHPEALRPMAHVVGTLWDAAAALSAFAALRLANFVPNGHEQRLLDADLLPHGAGVHRFYPEAVRREAGGLLGAFLRGLLDDAPGHPALPLDQAPELFVVLVWIAAVHGDLGDRDEPLSHGLAHTAWLIDPMVVPADLPTRLVRALRPPRAPVRPATVHLHQMARALDAACVQRSLLQEIARPTQPADPRRL